MCGIAGIISSDPAQIRVRTLQAMADSLVHRGPDGDACWISPAGYTGFAHRRLAVIDPVDTSAQPMHYLGRYTIVFNGEIYNYQELREGLIQKGYSFRTASDTEVILASYDLHKENCLESFDGMFSFALWDEQEQSLFCARDRFGEKPFYYLHVPQQGTFYFGSEMKALYAAGIARGINHPLLLQFLAHGYTSSPEDHSQTFDGNIQQLPPSHYLRFSVGRNQLSVHRYWHIDKNYRISITEEIAVQRFLSLFGSSVNSRLKSDVSLGTSLSGGLDSSSIAVTIASRSPGMFKTFTAAFPGFAKDESALAQDVADRCGFENYMISTDAEELLSDLQTLMYHQEEPFSSASVYAQYRVYQLAKQNGVTVLLDGQGADETLAGYDHYRTWAMRSLLPRTTAAILKHREQRALRSNQVIDAAYTDAWDREGPVKPVVRTLNDLLYHHTFQSGLGDLLRYADRNSMAHGREVRLPFLSHDLVSFIFSLPDHLKIRKGWTKWLLRTAMKDQLPGYICWRTKKIGFEPPQREWMQHRDLSGYIREAQTKLADRGILNKRVVAKQVVAHSAYEHRGESWRHLVAYLYLTLQNKKGV